MWGVSIQTAVIGRSDILNSHIFVDFLPDSGSVMEFRRMQEQKRGKGVKKNLPGTDETRSESPIM